ncbi:hypothetical protein [Streptomyces sp. NBRC 110028]|uniref:hypothetical protein n=1 Tax=Streptomyces sp. NBRC 110028 TaxID=1621260 RepID=UPI0018FEEFD3|nr:hypothetical protein [Streptomyces sp. NBRC 110028]
MSPSAAGGGLEGAGERGAAAGQPALAAVPSLAVAALVVRGAAGWALQVPRQHRLPAREEERGTVAPALNNPALYLGGGRGRGPRSGQASVGCAGPAERPGRAPAGRRGHEYPRAV